MTCAVRRRHTKHLIAHLHDRNHGLCNVVERGGEVEGVSKEGEALLSVGTKRHAGVPGHCAEAARVCDLEAVDVVATLLKLALPKLHADDAEDEENEGAEGDDVDERWDALQLRRQRRGEGGDQEDDKKSKLAEAADGAKGSEDAKCAQGEEG